MVLFVVLLKGVLILLVATALRHSLRRRPAGVRHALWTFTFGALVTVTVTPLLLTTLEEPVLPVPVFPTASSSSPTAPELARSPVAPLATAPNSGTAGLLPPLPPAEVTTTTSFVGTRLVSWLGFAWAAGALLLLLRLAWEFLALHRAKGTGRAPGPDLQRLLERCARRIGLAEVPALRLSPEIPVPLVSDLSGSRGIVLLPTVAATWSRERLGAVLLHELAHIRRRDPVVALLTAVACALHWPNPLVWWAARRAVADREEACDDCVLRSGTDRYRYARHLLETARGLAVQPRGWATVPVRPAVPEMASPSTLRRRIEALVDRRRSIAALTGAGMRRAVAAALIVILPLACAELTDRQATAVEAEDLVPLGSLLAELKTGSAQRRVRAAWALGEREDHEAGPALVTTLEDPDPTLRGMAAWALGEIKDPATLEPLLAALVDPADPDPIAREMIVRAVGEIEDPRAVPALIEVAAEGPGNPPDPAGRAAAVWALSDFPFSAEARLAVEAALSDEALAVRKAAVAALGEMARDAEAAATLLPLLDDEEPVIRALSARSLGRIGDPQAVDALIAGTRDPDPQVRNWTVWAMDEINLRR